MSELLDSDRVCCSGLIVAELMQGAKSERELGVIKDFTYLFDFLEATTLLWEKAGHLSYSLRRKGKTIGLADCLIAVSAHDAGVRLFTLDNHFECINDVLELPLFAPPGPH